MIKKICLCSAFYFDPGEEGTDDCPIHGDLEMIRAMSNNKKSPVYNCPRCGDTFPLGCQPDGCRDPDCPVAK